MKPSLKFLFIMCSISHFLTLGGGSRGQWCSAKLCTLHLTVKLYVIFAAFSFSSMFFMSFLSASLIGSFKISPKEILPVQRKGKRHFLAFFFKVVKHLWNAHEYLLSKGQFKVCKCTRLNLNGHLETILFFTCSQSARCGYFILIKLLIEDETLFKLMMGPSKCSNDDFLFAKRQLKLGDPAVKELKLEQPL